ncbi:DUF3427 domain-containing protein [Gordonia sp. NPDC003376]
MHDPLAPGIYESVVTHRLEQLLGASELDPEYSDVPESDRPHVFARHLAVAAERHLAALPKDQQLTAVNSLIAQLTDGPLDQLGNQSQLTSLHAPGKPSPVRPATPLSEVALLTNTRDEPNMASEIARELQSVDRVDLLCAFIRFAGIAVIKRELAALRDRGVKLRVITTTYRGATQRRALDELVEKYGAEVRIRYETASTRLHAKAWLFRRHSGFDTGYVGSSNLSRSAMVDGLEWNVRISSVATPTLVRKFEATFDTYWADPAFKTYNPATDADLLDRALAAAGGAGTGRETITISGLDVQPYPHQERILEALDVARTVYDRHNNLIVAATGTGKTVVAALDYQRLCQTADEQLSLLFIAHRKEILEQSLRKYREVLGDGSFGELLVGGHRPANEKHVFASIQSLNGSAANIDPGDFDVVVIDEFHHAAAPTYRTILDSISPTELLGLTATPERADNLDILGWFGGQTTYELRLWDALEQDLLCPFHYYGISDNTDLRSLAWSRGDYKQADLEKVYTGNHARTLLILKAVREYVESPTAMKALGFCVSIKHAEDMADAFSRQGIRSAALTADTSPEARARALAELRAGTIQCLFAVDIFNEGVDIPDVDTLLMLRPTQSATIFLQQLGRGLRRSRNKSQLTVLDFIGHQRVEFNYGPRFAALTGDGSPREIEEDFPLLPGGSRIVLDRQAQEIVVESIKRAVPSNRRAALVQSVRSTGTAILSEYLRASGCQLSTVYGGSSTRAWTPLLRDAGMSVAHEGPDEASLLKRVRTLAHVDDFERAASYKRLAAVGGPSYASLSERDQAYARMLIYTVWPNRGGFATWDAALDQLREHPAICTEVHQLLEVTTSQIHHVPRLSEGRPDLPLLTHAQYRREEVLAAIGFATLQRKAQGQAGGAIWHDTTAALFVNLHKSESQFSPTTMYRDYPISREMFHWESPNNTAADSEMGQRYLSQRSNGCTVLLFVRDHPDGQFGSSPYVYLGPVDYVSHQGERPIAITWKLRRPMPIDVFESGAVIAG